ncbi:hypothetical protein DFH05DRAFT_1376223, partial [Lentinula detonsa]
TVIPTLKIIDTNNTVTRTAETNEDKAQLLAKTFFPAPPPNYNLERNPCRNQLPNPPKITQERIIKTYQKLKPYKAPGPDGIPNVILKKYAGMLAPYMSEIYNAIGDLKIYPRDWLTSTTIVLRKPAKKSYSLPKSYRPIALINTLAKGFTSIVAQDISYLADKHNLLPDTQFGG